jgi:hypothetical protein
VSLADATLHRLRARVADIEAAPARAMPRAAARIQERFRADATTRRGNVPGFGHLGGPITVTPQATGLAISAPGWVMGIAYERAQPSDWRVILVEEIRAEARG